MTLNNCAAIFLKLLEIKPDLKIKIYKNYFAVFTLNKVRMNSLINKEFPTWFSDFLFFAVCDGKFTITVNYKTYVVNKNCMFILYGKNIINKIEFSEDFEAKIIITKSSFMRNLITNSDTLLENIDKTINSYPLLVYNDIDFMWLNKNITELESAIEQKNSYNKEKSINKVLLYFWVDVIKHNNQSKEICAKNSKEVFVYQFYKLASEGFLKDKLVTHYADMLKVDSIKLSYIIKSCIGISPRDIINDIIIAESKLRLLKYDIPISHIAKDLGYNDQAAFSKFFTSKVKISPMQYRKIYYKLLNF